MTENRACRRCGEVKPYDADHFARKMHGKLQNFCKKCDSKAACERKKARQAGLPPQKRGRRVAIVEGKRHCTICEQWKPLEDFFAYSRKGIDIRYTSRCKLCHNSKQRQYRELNYSHKLELQRTQQKRFRESGKARLGQIKWRRENIEKARQYVRNRRARLISASGSHDRTDVINQMNKQKGRCYWCHKEIKGNEYHVDHYIALVRGGGNGPDNIVCACPQCNQSKGKKMPWEFLPGRFTEADVRPPI